MEKKSVSVVRYLTLKDRTVKWQHYHPTWGLFVEDQRKVSGGLCHIKERYSDISLLPLLRMNPNLGQVEDTPTWPFTLPNSGNVAGFTKHSIPTKYKRDPQWRGGDVQALQSLGQLTSVTASHCSLSNTSQAFPPLPYMSLMSLNVLKCLKCLFFPLGIFKALKSSHSNAIFVTRPYILWETYPHLLELPWHHRASYGTCLSATYVPRGIALSVNSHGLLCATALYPG